MRLMLQSSRAAPNRLTCSHRHGFPLERRGGKLVVVSVLDVCMWRYGRSWVYIYSKLCCLIVGEFFVQSTQLSGCVEWGGEGDVDQGVFARV